MKHMPGADKYCGRPTPELWQVHHIIMQIMENQMEKKMENEVETGIGVI